MVRPSIPVLCYHNIDATGDSSGRLGHPLALFEEHLDLLSRLGFRTISAGDAVDVCLGARPAGRREVVLTFDDCHVSQWLHAAPLLAARGMTGTFFAVTDFVREGPLRAPADAPDPLDAGEAFARAFVSADYTQFANRAELASLVHDFGMEVYAHSSRHQPCFANLHQVSTGGAGSHWAASAIYEHARGGYPVFRHASAYAHNGFWPAEADPAADPGTRPTFVRRSDRDREKFCRRDFLECFERARELNGNDRQLFCWPWGQYDDISRLILREVGFEGAFCLDRGPLRPGSDPTRICRIRVGRTKSAGWLRAHLAMFASVPGATLFAKTQRTPKDIRRVLYVTDSMRQSGGSRQLLNNAAAMVESGLDVVAVVPQRSALFDALAHAGATTIDWPEPKRLFTSVRLLRRITRERHVDVVHTFHNRAIKAAVLTKLWGSGFGLYLNRGVIYRPNPLIGLFAAVADGVVCNSRAAATRLAPYLVPARKRHVVYNSVVKAFPKRHTQSAGPLRVIYVGNGNPAKGPDVFLRVASQYRRLERDTPAAFVAYGLDSPIDSSWCVPDDTMNDIELHGTVPHTTVLEALAGADIFVLTSRLESLPNVLLEAFVSSLPVVCTAVGGVEELVEHGFNGLVYPVEDVDGLVEGIVHLVRDPEARRTMGENNRRLAETHFANGRKTLELLRLYSGDHVISPAVVGVPVLRLSSDRTAVDRSTP